MDIDMLGKSDNDEDNIKKIIKDIIESVDVSDGLISDPDTIGTEKITEDAEYDGIRVKFLGYLNTFKIHMQIDIGFGEQ